MRRSLALALAAALLPALGGCTRKGGAGEPAEQPAETGGPTPASPPAPDRYDAMPENHDPKAEAPADAAPPSPEVEAAAALLSSPDTWCDGAKKLTVLGDRAGLLPLMRAYEARSEGNKLCLLDAIEALGAAGAAREMLEGGDAETRRLAAHMMELVPDPGHVAPLEEAAADPDPKVREQALRALATQKQTPAWEEAMVRLLSSPQRDARAQAIESLSRRRTDSARQALKARVATEPDAALKKRLQEITGG